ncbi:MAG: T9SS type A sorting domain-containing protein [Bacteroidia bacterium]|nr:T9SS type A sorting domain-containing protein [Bacteroidia bacterium]
MINYIRAAKILLLTIFFVSGSSFSYSQVILEADGPGNTYELINSVLAPGYDVVENPECIHPEFGRHIAEVWDADLNQYVFEFYIHVTPDNDRCIMFDRQRMEIKTYDKSPENLKGVTGETVVYKWKFRLPAGFQPSSSFTHIHQIKAVGGNDSDPIFTLTPRKGTTNKLELIHNNLTKPVIVDLAPFLGTWVEATERIKIDSLHGTYSIVINRVSDGITLLSYSNNNLMTIRSDNVFIRPKWGIYRSLNNPSDLRDEAVRFAGFFISEETLTADILIPDQEKILVSLFPNPSSGKVFIEYSIKGKADVNIELLNLKGEKIKTLLTHEIPQPGKNQKTFDISDIKTGLYFVRFNSGKFTRTIKLCVENKK